MLYEQCISNGVPLLHNVKGDRQNQRVTSFTSCKSVPRQVSHCAKAKAVQHSGKPNIISPLLHNVKGDRQNQRVTTFTSCKSTVTRQVSCCANKKEIQHSGKPNIILPLLHKVKVDN
jgi:hypothetical protein